MDVRSNLPAVTRGASAATAAWASVFSLEARGASPLLTVDVRRGMLGAIGQRFGGALGRGLAGVACEEADAAGRDQEAGAGQSAR